MIIIGGILVNADIVHQIQIAVDGTRVTDPDLDLDHDPGIYAFIYCNESLFNSMIIQR